MYYKVNKDNYMSETEWIEIFGDNLIDILKEQNLSQKELARLAGISESSISRIISKSTLPNVRTVLNLSYALNIDILDFIDFGSPLK